MKCLSSLPFWAPLYGLYLAVHCSSYFGIALSSLDELVVYHAMLAHLYGNRVNVKYVIRWHINSELETDFLFPKLEWFSSQFFECIATVESSRHSLVRVSRLERKEKTCFDSSALSFTQSHLMWNQRNSEVDKNKI
jgi:hypothetical protein